MHKDYEEISKKILNLVHERNYELVFGLISQIYRLGQEDTMSIVNSVVDTVIEDLEK